MRTLQERQKDYYESERKKYQEAGSRVGCFVSGCCIVAICILIIILS